MPAVLPEPDASLVEEFWNSFAIDHRLDPQTRPADVFSFGDSPAMADRLLALVVDGPKRATAGTVAEYEHEGIDIPRIGDFSVVCDGRGIPRAVIRTTDICVGPLSSVDDRFAWDEGEGDRTRPDWLRAHTEAFTRCYDRLGLDFADDIEVFFERFDLLTPAGDRSPAPTSVADVLVAETALDAEVAVSDRMVDG